MSVVLVEYCYVYTKLVACVDAMIDYKQLGRQEETAVEE